MLVLGTHETWTLKNVEYGINEPFYNMLTKQKQKNQIQQTTISMFSAKVKSDGLRSIYHKVNLHMDEEMSPCL